MRIKCPKRMLNGPCGGLRGRLCEVDDFECPFLKAFENLRNDSYLRPILDRGFKVECKPKRPEETSEFMNMLNEKFVVTTEVEPWSFEELERFMEIARLYDAVNVTDNPLGLPHIDVTFASAWLKERGVEVIAQLTTRARTREALFSSLLALWASGVRNVLALTGDWAPNSTFDLDSVRLVCLISLLNQGLDWEGRKVPKASIHPGVAANPYFPYEEKRLLRKVRAGAQFAQSQPVFEMKVLKKFKDFPLPTLPSLLITTSRKVVKFLEEKGVAIPKDYEEGLKRAKEKGEADEYVIDKNLEVLEEILSLELPGVHVMAPGRPDLLVKFSKEIRRML
ncbi:hypothetical protein IPA_01940 [Ignicoccus pacificus DSM 13166]|uniref:Methylene-tetrahydrofolate reductase C-terminal-like domain-containing protein n=1 Tax=Ignicoccus pacificus DSM 13166 TaxID=940294 RepID=A0A977PJU8_9CREN|nr:hypothetical protein IPA_01940 [Ignicoccus pacificus DSM 13166]